MIKQLLNPVSAINGYFTLSRRSITSVPPAVVEKLFKSDNKVADSE